MFEPRSAGLPLSDRVVLVTGATGGLGSAIAKQSARQGATVVLLGRRVASLEKLYDELEHIRAGSPTIYPIDLLGANADELEALVETLQKAYGRLDALIHAAAHFSGLAPLSLLGTDEWMKNIHLNLTMPWLLTKLCMPLLEKAAAASVVFALEDEERITQAYWGGYGVAKSALDAMFRIYARELENGKVKMLGAKTGPMRTKLRANAYMTEDGSILEDPVRVAERVVDLLDGRGEHGRVYAFSES